MSSLWPRPPRLLVRHSRGANGWSEVSCGRLWSGRDVWVVGLAMEFEIVWMAFGLRVQGPDAIWIIHRFLIEDIISHSFTEISKFQWRSRLCVSLIVAVLHRVSLHSKVDNLIWRSEISQASFQAVSVSRPLSSKLTPCRI